MENTQNGYKNCCRINIDLKTILDRFELGDGNSKVTFNCQPIWLINLEDDKNEPCHKIILPFINSKCAKIGEPFHLEIFVQNYITLIQSRYKKTDKQQKCHITKDDLNKHN